MDMPPLPGPPHRSLTSSRFGDLLVGFALAVLTWGVGISIALGMHSGEGFVTGAISGVLLFAIILAVIARKPGSTAMVVSYVLSTLAVPAAGFLALLGMCMGIVK